MKKMLCLLVMLGTVSAHARPSRALDLTEWEVTGRVVAVATSVNSAGSRQVSVTLGSVVTGGATVYTAFLCADTADCRPTILGSCTKQTYTSTQDGPTGAATYTTTSCINPHYADCWTFSGHLTPQLWGDSQANAYGCNF